MSTKKSKSTGPITPEGKAKSSQNARKASIFYQGYLPWEKPEEKQAEFMALTEQWQAHDPTRQLILRGVVQASLGLERMMYAERMVIEGAMQSTTIAKKFYEEAGLDLFNPLGYTKLPAWYFVGGDHEKKVALYLAKIYDQADGLKSRYSDALVAQVPQLFPDLYEYVMQKQQGSFLTILGQRYKQSTPVMNLTVMMNTLLEKYPHHFQWAQAPERYQAIIDGLRGQQMIEKIDLDKSNRYATSFQNRMLKGFVALESLSRFEMAVNAAQLTHEAKEVSNGEVVELTEELPADQE